MNIYGSHINTTVAASNLTNSMLNMHCGRADDCNLNVFKDNYYMKVYSDGAATITFLSAKDGNIIVASLHRRWCF